ncbi:MAG: glycosyltransferase family 2 protein [Deltaproteobacteria bacterium]|nr:MAG: glycosyltransferase family 2 protein [Deltaproteobacteria bacterium]
MASHESPAVPRAPRLSIVIPAYDEAQRIGPALRSIASHFGERRGEVEAIVIDDGSRDGTADVAEAVAAEIGLRLRVHREPQNRGKGFAVRRGMLDARGGAVLFTDADLSVSIDHVDRFLARLDEGADAVVGSRRAPGAHIARHQPALRERLGSVFRELARVLLVPGVSDFTCGFKLYRREAAQRIFSRQRLWGWGFDVEIALIARRQGLRVVEEPVEWVDDARSRVRLGRDALRSALDLARIRWNDLRGRYA